MLKRWRIKEKILFYLYLYVIHYWCSSFLWVDVNFHLLSFLLLREFPLILVDVNIGNESFTLFVLFFFWSENLYLINFGKIFSLYKKIFGWLFLYFSTLKMSFYHLLALILSDKKSDFNLTFVAFYIISFSPCCFQDFTFMIVVRAFLNLSFLRPDSSLFLNYFCYLIFVE